MKYIIELEKGVWLGPWEDDPLKKITINNAKEFSTWNFAMRALEKARKLKPFPQACIWKQVC